jgi:hypothetical protein
MRTATASAIATLLAGLALVSPRAVQVAVQQPTPTVAAVTSAVRPLAAAGPSDDPGPGTRGYSPSDAVGPGHRESGEDQVGSGGRRGSSGVGPGE